MKGVMELSKTKNWILYRAACKCLSSDHDITIEIEVDDYDFIYLTFYKEISASSYNKNWFLEKMNRIKMAFKILFTGYINTESDFILGGETQINDFLAAIESGKNYLKNKGGGEGGIET